MSAVSVFPEFKPLQLDDRYLLSPHLWGYQPFISELTFTNLFIWRHRYRYRWSFDNDILLLIGEDSQGPFALEPIGTHYNNDKVFRFLQWLSKVNPRSPPRIERAGPSLAAALREDNRFVVESSREHWDYVYNTEEMIDLPGRKYHAKRNHISQFSRQFQYTYEPLNDQLIGLSLDLSNRWCSSHHCTANPDLCAEWQATHEALIHFRELGIKGAAILIDGRVEAFSAGELLNSSTSVIHVEKANTEISGIYACINQLFCEREWKSVPFINREQDLGEPGLRKAKLSYFPSGFIEKFRISLR